MLKRMLCWVGEHDWTTVAAECHGIDLDECVSIPGPPTGHPCHPKSGDSPETLMARFRDWARMYCRRCGRVYRP